MFKIFISSKSLAKIVLCEASKEKRDQSSWFRILARQDRIFTEGYVPPEELFDENDDSDEAILWRFENDYNPQLCPEDRYISNVKTEHAQVLSEPCSVFYLDITPEDAEDIQNKYGVICQSAENEFDDIVLTDRPEVYDSTKFGNTSQKYWSNVFDLPHQVPSNAICVIDRNLFVYDGKINPKTKKEQSDGIYNLFFILDEALPKCFHDAYHVTIITEQRCAVDKEGRPVLTEDNRPVHDEDFSKKLAASIFQLKDLLKRDYAIVFEVFTFRKNCKFYNELTHSRQIISNYYRIAAENGLNTVNFSFNTANYPQQLNVHLLYSTGLKREGADTTADTNNRMILTYQKFHKYWMNDMGTDEYWHQCCMGDSLVENHKNRLFS